MIEATFTPEMLNRLKTIKGKTFKSYEFQKEGKTARAYGNLRINLGRSAVDLWCVQHRVDDFFGKPEDMAFFTCEATNPKSPFEPYMGGDPIKYLVDERVTNVAIVQDNVAYNNDECIIKMDIALIIGTKYHSFAFSRGIWFAEYIDIGISDAAEEPAGIATEQELWIEPEKGDPEEGAGLQVECARTTILL